MSYALTPILPFDPATWLFLLVTLNICIVGYYAIKYYAESFDIKQSEDVVSRKVYYVLFLIIL